MRRIDPREPGRQEFGVVQRAPVTQIDVGHDEARQDEKDVHAQPRPIEQAGGFGRQRPV